MKSTNVTALPLQTAAKITPSPKESRPDSNNNQYHSQIGQDAYLDEVIFRGRRNGFYVEVGAVDGLHFSNTLFFEQHRGWNGICIEPNPIEYKKLLNSGRKCIMENVAISSKEGFFPFLSIDGYGKGLSGLIDSYDPRHVERIKRETRDKGSILNTIQVRTAPLKTILRKHHIETIDYCSIDCEGAEMEILESIDFDSVHFRCMTIENNYGLERETRLLEQLGFVLYRKIRWDDVFVHRDDLPDLSSRKPAVQIYSNLPNQKASSTSTTSEIIFVPQSEATQRLNPHFVKILPMEANVKKRETSRFRLYDTPAI
jgi:FkbM family methyltransferase